MRNATARRRTHSTTDRGPETGAEPAAASLLGQLDALLETQLEAARRLRTALAAEHAALTGRDAAAVATSCRVKARVVEDMAQLERDRRALCLRLGAGPGWPELAAWVEAFSDGGELSARRSACLAEIAGLLRECHAANGANGMVAAMLHRRVQQAEELLRGNPARVPPGRVGGPGDQTDPGRDIWRSDLT